MRARSWTKQRLSIGSLVRPTSKAIYFEIGLICLNFIAALLAIAVGLYVSVWGGLLLFVVLILGLTSLVCNYDALVVRRLSTEESPLLLSLCQTGCIGRVRRMLKILPSDPRCRFCQAPFGGVGKVIGIRPSSGKPKLLPQLLRGAADDDLRTGCGHSFRRSARFHCVVREPRLARGDRRGDSLLRDL